MIYKRVLSDVLFDVVNEGFGCDNKIINEAQLKKLKLMVKKTIFKILSNDESDTGDGLHYEKDSEI